MPHRAADFMYAQREQRIMPMGTAVMIIQYVVDPRPSPPKVISQSLAPGGTLADAERQAREGFSEAKAAGAKGYRIIDGMSERQLAIWMEDDLGNATWP